MEKLFDASCCIFQQPDGKFSVSIVFTEIPDQELAMRISESVEQYVRGPLSELVNKRLNEPQPPTRTVQ